MKLEEVAQDSAILNHENASLKSIIESRLGCKGDSLFELQQRYVLKCMETLEIWLDKDMGIKDQRNCNVLLSLIFCWGIAPGLDREMQKVLLDRYKYPELDELNEIEFIQSRDFMIATVQRIFKIMIGKRNEITDLIYKKHFQEVFGAMLFIDYKNLCWNGLEELRKERTTETMQNVLETMAGSTFPNWAKELITEYLCKLIIKQDGVYSLILVLSIEKEKDALNLVHFEKISQLLVQCPSPHIAPKTFYPGVIEQLITLMTKYESEISRMASFVLVSFYNRKPKMARALISPLLFGSLSTYSKPQTNMDKGQDLDGNDIISTEKEILETLTNIEKLMVGNEPSTMLTDELLEVLLPLLCLYQYSSNTRSSIYGTVNQILVTIARLCDTRMFVSKLMKSLRESVILPVCLMKPGPSGGIQYVSQKEYTLTINSDLLLIFLQSLENPELVGELFVQIVEEHMIMNRNMEEFREEQIMYFASLILQMLDTFGETLLKNVAQILKFVKATLLDEDPENLHMGLTLLTQLLGPADQPLEFEESETKSMQEISIILSTLADHDDNTIAALACKLRMRIITSGKSMTKNKSLELFREAIKELSDELLPIRAHGMSILRQLVLTKDPIAIEHLDSIITIFLDLIQDEDSFIYLNAIKGCSALADKFPTETISRMTTRYKEKEFGLDNRLRMGESILQIIQRSGDAFPVYAKQICPVLLVVLREPVPELQSSALILCSVVAKQTPWVLVPVIYQLLDYTISILKQTQHVAPKRGALVFISNLIRSLGFEFGSVVNREWFETVRNVIRRMEVDADVVSRGHAQSIIKDLNQFI